MSNDKDYATEMEEEQREAWRLLKAIDTLATRLSDTEKGFVSNVLDKWKGNLTPKQIMYIEAIASKHGVL